MLEACTKACIRFHLEAHHTFVVCHTSEHWTKLTHIVMKIIVCLIVMLLNLLPFASSSGAFTKSVSVDNCCCCCRYCNQDSNSGKEDQPNRNNPKPQHDDQPQPSNPQPYPSDPNTGSNATPLSPIDQYFKKLREGLAIVKTTTTPNGQVIDWISATSQGLLADPPPLPLVLPDKAEFSEGVGVSDLELAGTELGPAGSVPVVRPNTASLSNNMTLVEFESKNDTRYLGFAKEGYHSDFFTSGTVFMNRTRFTNSTVFTNSTNNGFQLTGTLPAVAPHWYANSNAAVENYGGQGQYNLANPTTLTNDFSLVQTAIIREFGNLPFGSTAAPGVRYTQTLEAGLIVQAGRYKDFKTHLFTFYTTNGYNGPYGDNVEGWNREVGGWVQISRKIAPSIIFTPPSVDSGMQYKVWIVYQLFEGNWWLWVKNEWIGYYPAHLFSDGRPAANVTLADHADHIAFYGEVFDSLTDPNPTTTDMGTGMVPGTRWQHSAYIHNLLYQALPGPNDGENNSNTYYDGTNGISLTDTAFGYDVEPHFDNRDSWGSFFWFGGPGTV